MNTQINGRPASWPEDVLVKWRARWIATGDERQYEGTVSYCNYYTPRPYVDEYNRGSRKEGFVYVIGTAVADTVVAGGIPCMVSEPGERNV